MTRLRRRREKIWRMRRSMMKRKKRMRTGPGKNLGMVASSWMKPVRKIPYHIFLRLNNIFCIDVI